METISIKRFGFAAGATSALLYLGCVLVTLVAPREAALKFFNSLTHLIDWEPIVRWEMSVGEMILGLVEVFLLGWLTGAAFAAFYNLAFKVGRPQESQK